MVTVLENIVDVGLLLVVIAFLVFVLAMILMALFEVVRVFIANYQGRQTE